MSIFSWWIFTNLFLKRDVILSHPFSWMFYLSMVLYRYLPLIATFFDGKPITYGFENPYYTIFGEMLLLQYNHWHFISYVMVNKMDLEHYSA